MNLAWGVVRSHSKFGPVWFSRFDVYSIQTDKQTGEQSIYIDLIVDERVLILVKGVGKFSATVSRP